MQNTKKEQKKLPKWATITLTCSIVFMLFIVVISNCGSNSGENATKANIEIVEDSLLIADGTELLLTYIYENTELGDYDDIKVEVITLSKTECSMRIMIPEDFKLQSNIFGMGTVLVSTKWLQIYDCDISKMFIRCYVYSPHNGVTRREGLIKKWGDATYDYETDNIKWEWAKK